MRCCRLTAARSVSQPDPQPELGARACDDGMHSEGRGDGVTRSLGRPSKGGGMRAASQAFLQAFPNLGCFCPSFSKESFGRFVGFQGVASLPNRKCGLSKSFVARRPLSATFLPPPDHIRRPRAVWGSRRTAARLAPSLADDPSPTSSPCGSGGDRRRFQFCIERFQNLRRLFLQHLQLCHSRGVAHDQPRARLLHLVGSRLPSPYHFRARIQSFQPVAAPFPGDSVFAVRPSRAAIPATETPLFKDR